MAKRKAKVEQIPTSGKILRIVLCFHGEGPLKSFPQIEVVTNPLSISYDEVVKSGADLALYFANNCSGPYMSGLRNVLSERIGIPDNEKLVDGAGI